MELVTSLNKLVNLSMEEGFAKEAIADLSLKVLLLRLLQTQNRLSVNSNQPMYDNRIQPAINYVHKHLTEKITVEKLARECCLNNSFGMCSAYAHRPCKKIMADSSVTVTEACYASGLIM